MKARALLLLAISLIALIVLPWGDFQDHTHWSKVGWIPFVSKPVRLRDIVANVLLFMPFGAAAALSARRAPLMAGALGGATLSLLSETAQLYSHTRFPSATDVIANTVGAAAAALLISRHLNRS